MALSEHRHKKLMRAVAHIIYLANGGEYCYSDVPMWAKRKAMGKVRKIMRSFPEAWQELIDTARGKGCNKEVAIPHLSQLYMNRQA